MGKTRIAREITINAPRHDVWKALSDFGHVENLNPNIASSHLTSLRKSGIGITRHCDLTALGATLEERVTEWKEDAYMAVDAYDFENLDTLKEMHEYFWLEEDGAKTILKGTLEYKLSEDIGSVMNELVIERINIKRWIELLAGTKKYVETHTPVDRTAVLHTEEVRTLL